MKILTKEWYKELEYHNLIVTLEPHSYKKIPFIFLNGGEECVAKEDLYTVKSNFNLTEKENEIKFILLPEVFDLELGFLNDSEVINDKMRREDFILQYNNLLRVISNLPDDILKLIKDKRLLALGYAEGQAKKEILKYIKSRYVKAYDTYEKCCQATVNAEEGLTIRKQFGKRFFSHSVSHLFDGVDITKVVIVGDEIHLTLDSFITVVFSGAEIIEEEVGILNSCVIEVELYKQENRYELHFLVMKKDESFIEHYYYVTYAFKDLKYKD